MSKSTKQETEARHAKWDWVETSVWTSNMLAALGNGVKGGKWFSLIDKVHSMRTLRAAWYRVRANRGAAGVDKVSIKRFQSKAEAYLEELSSELKRGSFQPLPVRRTYIPKADGGKRPLGIPTVKDRVVQAALKIVLEPIFERDFSERSYGFRPKRGAKGALREVDRLLKQGYGFVVDADIRSYFDSISHEIMMDKLKEKIADGQVLQLVDRFLNQEIFDGLNSWSPTKGTPQGAVLSPLLANLYLDSLDKLMANAGVEMCRYADDFVILCRSLSEAECALEMVRGWCGEHSLELHPDKTRLVDTSVDKAYFEFLGYRFQNGKRYVRQSSLKKLRRSIAMKTKRKAGKSLQQAIEEVNPTLSGWFAYFKHAHRSTFKAVDGYVRRRLRAMLRVHKKKRARFGANHEDHRMWPNTFFASQGLFTLETAWQVASQSRCGNR